jgi:Ca-activated chloride channel family protein
MKKKINRQSLRMVVGLLLLTGAAMGIIAHFERAGGQTSHMGRHVVPIPDGTLAVETHLVQDKVLIGSDGRATLALTLQAAGANESGRAAEPPVDLVVVLDRSGSMNGRKIQDARRAVQTLIETLSRDDRLGIVTYSDRAEPLSDLRPMTEARRHALAGLVREIQPGGGTNLGAGLETGLALFAAHPMDGRHRKLLLISDGLANHGVTDPHALGRMAAAGLSKDWVVSTVGVGNDFNEHLMTTLADYGGGTYTYMEDPAAFAAVFQQEYRHAAVTAVSGLTVNVPLNHGIQLVDAGGYPIQTGNGRACFNPGGLRYGQTRTVYLTFQIPTDVPGDVFVEGLQLGFRNPDGQVVTRSTEAFTIACVANPAEVMASIHEDRWAAQVVQEDFGRLKAAVADALREGDEEQALAHIEAYRKEKEAINRVVASPKVSANLRKDVDALGAVVRDTFAGGPEAVMSQQKKNAKVLQYESYKERRAHP